MIARPPDVGKRIWLSAVVLAWTAFAWTSEPARIDTPKFLRDGKAESIVFDYQGTLRYRESQFPQAKYGYIDLEPAVVQQSKTRLKPLAGVVREFSLRTMRGDQRVRLLYELERWVAPTFHDSGSRLEIRFGGGPSNVPMTAEPAIPPLTPPLNDPPPSLAAGLKDDIFADYLKLKSDDPEAVPTAPAPPQPPGRAAATAVPEADGLTRAQGGEGSPSAATEQPAPADEPAETPDQIAGFDVVSGQAFVPEQAEEKLTDRITGGRGYEFVDLTDEIFQKQVSMTFKDADLQNAVRILSRHADLNVVMDPGDVRGQLTVELNDVPVGAALASILRTNKLELIREAGGIYRVVPTTSVRRERQIEEITVHIPLNWVSASDVKAVLDPVLDGDITADTMGNSIIITDTPLKIEEIANVIKRIDKPEKQVELEARLVEMNVDLSRAIGVNWDLTRLDRDVAHEALNLPKSIQEVVDTIPSVPVVVGYDPVSGAPIVHTPPGTDVTQAAQSFFTNPLSRAPASIQLQAGGGADSLGVFGPPNALPGGGNWAWGTDVNIFGQQFQLSTLLEAAEQANMAKTLVAPRVVTINNTPAMIDVTRKIPYSSTVIGQGGGQSITFDYEDVGVQLMITPNITNNDYVRMNIQPTQRIFISQVGNARPTIDERVSQTNVIVKDEQTAVIAGLREQDFGQGMNGVPWFNKVPVLGWWFKSKSYRNLKTDLLAFVTPHIIKEGQVLTDDENLRYNEIDVQWDLPDYFFDDVQVEMNQ